MLPHFPRSNGFIECQFRSIKTMLSTALLAKKPLETVLIDHRLTAIGPNMPPPRDILHNRPIMHPSKPSQPVKLERVRNFLLSQKQSQCQQFNKAHGAHDHPELSPGQEVLFRSPVDEEYIPGTRVDKATAPCSYFMEAQGKRYRRTRGHLWPIYINLLPPAPIHHSKQHIERPNPTATHIPKPNPLYSCLSRPLLPRPLPGLSSKPPATFHAPVDCSYHLPQCRPSSSSVCPQPPLVSFQR